VSAVVRAVKQVFKAVEKVVKKVVTAVVNVVKAAVKDPITTIAKIAAYATGNAWAIPLIDGASTLAKGGSIGDAIKSAAISYGTQAIAVKVGTPVGKAAGSFAASQGASVATQQLVTNIVTRGVGNAAVAVITKQDPVKAFVAGGVSAAAGAVLGQIPGFDKQPAWVQNTVASTVGAVVAGQQKFDEAAASILVATSGIVTEAIKLYDPDGTKLTAGQRAVATDAIFKTTSAALAGRSATDALTKSLTNAATAALGAYAKDTIKSATEGMADSYARITGNGARLDTIAAQSKSATERFNQYNSVLSSNISEQNRLYQVQADARAAYDANPTDANYNAAQSAVATYNNYATWVNSEYNRLYKPTLDALSNEVAGYQAEYDRITGVNSSEQALLKNQIDNLTKALDPVYANSNRAFAESLAPGFDAAAYKALNPNVPKDTDPYLHYITTGQFDGLKTTQAQLKESTEIVNAILSNPEADERALLEYVNKGYVTQDFVASLAKKNYNDLVNELDKRVTTEDEAKDFFKKIYGREAVSESDLGIVQDYTNLAETSAQRSFYAAKQIEEDNAMFVYKGSDEGSQAEAANAAQKEGYNTFSYKGSTYTILPAEERDQRVELGKQILASQGKNLVNATEQDIDRAMELANRVPQEKLKGASVQDVLAGNYSGWREGKYYEYAGDKLQAVYAIDPSTGKYSLERVEIGGGGIPDVVITAPRELRELATADPAGYLELANKLDDSAKKSLGNFFDTSINAAMVAAQTSGDRALVENIRQTYSVITQGVGQQTENLAKFFASVTGGSYDTSLIRAGKALQTWGAANQSASTVAQEKNIQDAVKNADGAFNKIGAFIGAVKDNPGGFATMVAKEGVQEVLPLWAARGVMAFGKIAAYSANAAVEGMESWGSSSGDVYDAAIKSGKNEVEARDMALKAGFQSAVITAVTVGVTDVPMVKKILGDGVVASYRDIGKATAASTMGEYVEELFQNANNQRIVTGTVNWDYATTAATIAAGTAAGTTGSIMTGLNIRETAFVAKDVNGNNVTLSDFLAGTKQVDMKTVRMDSVVGTSADGDNITLGGVAAMQMSSGVSYDTFKTSMPSVIANQDFILGTNSLGDQVTLSQAMGQVTSKQGFDTVYNNLLNTTAEQRVEAQTDFLKTTLANVGYKPNDAEIKSLVQAIPPGSNALTVAAQQYADTHTVTEAEATKSLKEAYTAAGFKDYTPTKEQITSFIKSGVDIDQTAVIGQIKTYVNENSVTPEEARKMLVDRGYSPTDAEVNQFVATVNQQVQLDAVAKYVDPRQVTYDEAKAMITKLGYTPDDAEVKQFMGQKNDAAYQAAQETSVNAYVDPRYVDEQEVRDALTAAGFPDATDAQVKQLAGQYEEAKLAGLTKENLPGFIYQALKAQIGESEANLNTKLADTDLAIKDVSKTLGRGTQQATKSDLDAMIQMLEKQGAYDPQYDYNGDKVIDQNDKVAIETYLKTQEPDYVRGDADAPFTYNPAAGSKWAPTGVYKTIEDEAEATRQAQAAEAEKTRQAQAARTDALAQSNAAQALRTQRMGNLNTMVNMLGQAGDTGGQQVTVKAADPAKIGYIYDWNSIFANPQQANMFVSPFAQGGVVNGSDDVNDELLKILKG